MTTLNINLSDDLKARLDALAAERGFDRVEAYIEAVLQAEGEPQTIEDEDLEALLLGRLDGEGSVELTTEFGEQFKQRVAHRRSEAKK